MTKILTEEQVRQKLKELTTKTTQTKLAESLGVSRTYICRFLYEGCGIGQKMAKSLGLKEKKVYLVVDGSLDLLNALVEGDKDG